MSFRGYMTAHSAPIEAIGQEKADSGALVEWESQGVTRGAKVA